MRNYAMLAVVLLCAIVLSSVSDSAAVYTHSQSYSGELTFHREITIDDFFHYEMVDTVADSTAVYDKEQKSIILQNESGAFIQHTKLPAKGDYMASVELTSIMPDTLQSIAFQFGGSANVTSEGEEGRTNYTAMGNILKFEDNGDLVIINQGFQKNLNQHDQYVEDSNHQVYHRIPTAELPALNGRPVTLRVFVKYNRDNENCSIYIVINDTLLNKDALIPAGRAMNTQFADQVGANQIITGVSSYGAGKQVTFTKLKIEPWDGERSSVY